MKLTLAWLAPAKSRTDNVSGLWRTPTNCSNPLLCLVKDTGAPLRDDERIAFGLVGPLLDARSAETGSLDVFRNRSHKEGHPTHLKKREGLAVRVASAGPSHDVTSLLASPARGVVVFEFELRRQPGQLRQAEAAARPL